MHGGHRTERTPRRKADCARKRSLLHLALSLTEAGCGCQRSELAGMIDRSIPVNEPPYWTIPADELLVRLQTGPDGLRAEEAQQRQAQYASARLKPRQDIRPLYVLLSQFRSPIILILL